MRVIFILVLLTLGMVAKAEAQQERPRLDPTRPPDSILRAGTPEGERAQRTPRLRLESIFYREGNARAYIDGAFYREGERIGEWRVRRIGAEVVELERVDERVSLRVFNFQEMTRSKEIE